MRTILGLKKQKTPNKKQNSKKPTITADEKTNCLLMPSFKGMIHVRVKKGIYPGTEKGNGVYVWESVTQVDQNCTHITDLLWLVSPHPPAAATGFVSWAQSWGLFAQEKLVGFFVPVSTSNKRMSAPFIETGFKIIAKEGLFFLLILYRINEAMPRQTQDLAMH